MNMLMKHVVNEYTSMYKYKYMKKISKTIIVNEKQNIYIPNLNVVQCYSLVLTDEQWFEKPSCTDSDLHIAI